MLGKKNQSQKAIKGSVRKPLSSSRYLYAVLFLIRDDNVILTSTNSWRLPLPAVTAKKQHALDSGHGFVVVMSDWTNLFDRWLMWCRAHAVKIQTIYSLRWLIVFSFLHPKRLNFMNTLKHVANQFYWRYLLRKEAGFIIKYHLNWEGDWSAVVYSFFFIKYNRKYWIGIDFPKHLFYMNLTRSQLYIHF